MGMANNLAGNDFGERDQIFSFTINSNAELISRFNAPKLTTISNIEITDLTSEYIHIFTRDMSKNYKTKVYLFKKVLVNSEY